ncbi:Golgi apparatus membrane protein TVP38 [Pseudozyma hubeiensis]|nr:Golgi apparatus membrane protein TVP38 [Pseudozyma hubeiensis]
MSNPYYSQQPSGRQPVYDNPLTDAPYQSHQQAYPYSTSQTNMLGSHQDGLDYAHFHAAPTDNSSYNLHPYHDPYNTTPASEQLRPSFSNHSQSYVRETPYTKEHPQNNNNSSDDDGHDLTPRGTEYPFTKDESSGRYGVGRGHRIEASDGLLPDTPPDVSRLNAEQREIMKQFPPDLDEPNGGKSGVQAAKDLLKQWKTWFHWRYLHWWVMLIVVIAIVALTTIYHKQIVDWLTPISKKVTTVAWGWIIPVAILFIISFPPLFGHEIVLILVGLVYGIWIGFGIASLGTLLGEIGNFYAFKHCLRSMASNYEKKNIHYACMAEMVRDGGFWVMFLARLSAIPGHFTTAVFATVGMNIFVFTFAAVLALPKQLLIVYLGVAIKNSGTGTEDTKSKVIKYVVLVISFIITVWTAYWLYQKMEKVRPGVSKRLRQKRYELLLQARTPGTEGYSGGREEHTYPPMMGGRGAVDASYGYRREERADDSWGGGGGVGDVSEETFNDSAYGRLPKSGGRQDAVGPNRQRSDFSAPPPAGMQYPTQPAPTPSAPAGRQPSTAPLQFHRPTRQNLPLSNAAAEPTSPFRDPPTALRPAHQSVAREEEEETPLTNANGEWASSSSLGVDGPPPDYVSFVGSSRGLHSATSVADAGMARGGVDPHVQRYHLSD